MVYIINYFIFAIYLNNIIMKENNNQMSSEESLRIISDMINKTRMNIGQGSFHLIFWGWLILVCSLSDLMLASFTSFEKSWLVWMLTIPGAFVSLIYGYAKGSRQAVYGYAERIYIWLWMGFMVTAILMFVFFSSEDWTIKIAPLILMLAGFTTFISGVIIKFRPLVIGGISIWIFSLTGIFAGDMIVSLTVPAAMLTGYIIPGYMLKKNGKQND